MIIVKLLGGLGNQMFQYAAARRLAEFHHTVLKLDVTELEDRVYKENFTYRYYSLNVFNIKEHIAQPHEIASYQKKHQGIIAKALNKVKQKLDTHFIIREKHFHFDENFLHALDNSYIDGYWQSEKYFKPIEEIIRKEFTFQNEPEGKNNELSQLISDTCSVSIHVRRGDYVTNKVIRQFHGVCSIDYYKEAVAQIAQNLTNPHFFLFSDDTDWVKKNIIFNHPTIYVDHNKAVKHYKDMHLMSLCKHNIIANSAFSWWGAWINTNKDKIVIAPKKWFNDASVNTQDLIPEQWIRM